MPVKAINDQYQFEPRDLQFHYGDNVLIYVGWDQHTLFCAAHALVVSPQQSFQDLIDQQLQGGFHQHPDFVNIDWSKAQYLLDGQAFTPVLDQTLESQNIGHKSLLRFATPGLDGYRNSHV
ncbi:phenol hydroxylase [Acinetobacter baumannii]|nr:phenol hydroxylase [Acinetobacter baumannii]